MATFRANAAGQYIDEGGNRLYDTFSQNAGGQFINSQGANLYGSPSSPYAMSGSPSQRSMAYAANRPAASPADLAKTLRDQYKTQMDAANAANQARYDEALGLNADLRLRQLGGIDPVTGAKKTGAYDTWGADQKLAISQAAQNAAGDINQAQVDRGIYNTSSALNKLSSAGAAAGVGIAGVEQDKLKLKNAADTQLTNDRINLIQSKVDQQPDLNQLIGLEQRVGSGSLDGMYGGGAGMYTGGGAGGAYGNPFVDAGAMGYSMPGVYGAYPQGGSQRQQGYAYGSPEYMQLMALKRAQGNKQVTGAIAGAAGAAARGAGRVAGAIAGVPGAIGNAIGGIGNLYGQITGAAPRPSYGNSTAAYPRRGR